MTLLLQCLTACHRQCLNLLSALHLLWHQLLQPEHVKRKSACATSYKIQWNYVNLKFSLGTRNVSKQSRQTLHNNCKGLQKPHTTPATEMKARDFYQRVSTRDKVMHILKNNCKANLRVSCGGCSA